MLLTIKRWLYLIILTAVAIIFLTLTFPILKKLILLLSTLSNPWSDWLRFLIFSLISGLLWSLLIRLGGFSSRHLYSSAFFKYPPVWFFGLIGVSFFLWMIPIYYSPKLYTCNELSLIEITICLFPILLGIFGAVFGDWLHTLLNNKTQKEYYGNDKEVTIFSDSSNSIINDPKKMIEWVEQESPIDNFNKDLLGFKIIAKKIVNLLCQNKLRSIGIIGQYGSGKSSLLKLVINYLHLCQNSQFKGKVIVCNIDGWGRYKGSVAQQILSIAVRELSLEVDCLSIITVPSNYNELLTTIKPPWSSIIGVLFNPFENPIKLLRKIDNILIATNIRLVLFLEDLDRNCYDDFILVEMFALLDRLHSLKNISFILTLGDEKHYSETLIRLFDHVEHIGVISHKKILEVIYSIRSICLKKYPEDIETMSTVDRYSRLKIEKKEHSFLELYNSPMLQIPQLLKTPRILKMALRRTVTAWDILHGEIDFDDLLVLNVLRFGAPQTYSFLNYNIDEIRELKRTSDATSKSKQKERLQSKWDSIKKDVVLNPTAAEELIKFLFPYWDIKGEHITKEIPQGVKNYNIENTYLSDYWIRANTESLDDVKIKDQDMLKALTTWENDKNSTSFNGMTFPRALYEMDYLTASKIGWLGDIILTGNDFRMLSQELFEIVLEKWGVAANLDSCSAIIHSIFYLSNRKFIKEKEHIDWIFNQIVVSLSKSLQFAVYQYDYFVPPIKDVRRELNKKIIEEAKKLFKDEPDRLIEVLDPKQIYTIFQFLYHMNLLSTFGNNSALEGHRKWIAQDLIIAAKKNPATILPQIVGLITGQLSDDEINIEVASVIFGDQVIDIMALLLNDFDCSHLSENIQNKILVVKPKVKEWLEKNA